MSATPATMPDPITDRGLVDLLGSLAYASLTAFGRTAADAELAPSQAGRVALSRLAVGGYRHFEVLVAELSSLGVEPDAAMAPFAPPIDAFHARTRSGDWLEGLLAAYVITGTAADLVDELLRIMVGPRLADLAAGLVPDPEATARTESGGAYGSATQPAGDAARQFVGDALRVAIATDAAVCGRLSLWSRRLLGEALSQAQRVAADRIELTTLLGGGPAEVEAMLIRLTDRHTERVRALGLT